ncbi:response regulator [Leeuwenhoekiella palythoae]|uniref:Two-component system KDP operon response regulator KdpE n=1 Tax=Leeuwenhoekiella palythoae TaxID=573501 RepID=A0A1M5TY18_9FLAO|nr:response regulator transcription factor [Leeuwenhoekiella palythoae]RXG28523.1 two-component system KDP operon response regulator KdpE [Leeuwenhoekiella palythoae]SHH55541.1 two-component system, OmpR family, KDP operon response regulator KdpE [Leeuwenhoekiella palythoae]
MNKAEILVIDDEPQIRKLLQINLESHDYKVLKASTAKEGLILAASHPPDLILLDIGLPDKSGHQVLQDLREWYTQPVIILSVIDSEDDIIAALDNGATDYLTKPFRTGELLARIRSALRRSNQSENNAVLSIGNITLDLVARSVTRNDIPIKLTATEYKLLCLFAKNEGRVLTHQYLLKEIWGMGYVTETQYLRVFVGTLRKKIEEDANNPLHILTESGVGYRFQ